MKRTSVLTAALCLFMAFTAVFSGCGSKDGEDMLIKAGLESAARMKEAVCNETYRNLLGASASMNDLDMVRIVSSENVVEYKAVYEVTFDPEKALGAITDRVEEFDTLPEYLQTKIIAQVYGSIPSMINSKKGSSALAFAAMFNESGSIEYKTQKERRTFVFVFETGYPIWVTYGSGGNGAVSYVSNWIIADGAQIDSEETFISELRIDTIPTLEVKKIR